jgi:hypothetical protein
MAVTTENKALNRMFERTKDGTKRQRARYITRSPLTFKTDETNSVALVRERTIPIERPPLVSEVSSNSCGYRVSNGQRNGSLRPFLGFLDRSRYFFFQVAPQLY